MTMRVLLIPLFMLAVAGCQGKAEDLKSPCVGAEQSPCDRRAPANQGAA